jgi:hypothetical protein
VSTKPENPSIGKFRAGLSEDERASGHEAANMSGLDHAQTVGARGLQSAYRDSSRASPLLPVEKFDIAVADLHSEPNLMETAAWPLFWILVAADHLKTQHGNRDMVTMSGLSSDRQCRILLNLQYLLDRLESPVAPQLASGLQ